MTEGFIQSKLVTTVLGAGICLLFASCGGGSGTPAETPQQGSGSLPGQQQGNDNTGTGGNGTGPGVGGVGSGGGSTSPTAGWGGGFYVAQPIQNTAGGSAPLGTKPEYQVTELGGTTTRESSRFTSITVGEIELTFDAIDAVMVPDGESPNWDATHAVFQEGQAIDIYFKYELNPNFPLNRAWTATDIGLEYLEPNVPHAENGVYVAKLDITIPWGAQVVNGELWTGVSLGSESKVIPEPFLYDVTSTTETYRAEFPTTDHLVEDTTGKGCIPKYVSANFHGTSVTCTSAKDIGSVVLEFEDGVHQLWDGLSGYEGTFYGTGDNANKYIVGVWIKSGCNFSGDGPGYGEYFRNPGADGGGDFRVSLAQMSFEDLIGSNDYDYNDFVGYINAIETRNANGDLLQIHFTLQAAARSANYDSDWQFNVNGAFPGATATAFVDQYYADGTRHGNQKIWRSTDGASVPVFTPIREALPSPPESFYTNGIAGTTYVEGDYAEVTVVFDSPVPGGSYEDAPYDPELRVDAGNGTVVTIDLWKERGDALDATGRPLAFIVPDAFAWPLEGQYIGNVYPPFADWLFYIDMHSNGNAPDPDWWTTDPVASYFDRALFLPYPES